MSKTEELLAERYGKKKTGAKVAVWSFVASLLVLFLSFAIYWNFFAKPVATLELLSFEQIDGNHIAARYAALTGSGSALCEFKAFDSEGRITGYLELELPPRTSDKVISEAIIKTVLPAVLVETDGCHVK